jgi:endonuclease III related protein
MNSSFELLKALKQAGYLHKETSELWWRGSGSFKVVVGAILTQQTRWEKVQKSLENLSKNSALSLEGIANQEKDELAKMIKPSGFYNTKAKNLQKLCQNILNEFENFENFSLHVTREWLLNQKGIGCESADCILCYACSQEVMVVDSYTNRLLKVFGYEFESYDALQEWMQEGIVSNWEKVVSLYDKEISLHFVYARFHGKIVEFCKKNMRKKEVILDELSLDK